MLTALCLDLMGTIVTDPYAAALEAATGMPLRSLASVRDRDAWPDFEMAHIEEAEFVARFFPPGSAEGLRFDVEAFHRVRRAGYGFLPGMEAILEDTRGHLDRYVASNYPVWIDELVQVFRLHERTEGVVASCHLGARKPDAAFYERFLDRIGHDPDACLFVDDREVNCTAAESAGMRAHRFVGAEDLRVRLVREGLDLPMREER